MHGSVTFILENKKWSLDKQTSFLRLGFCFDVYLVFVSAINVTMKKKRTLLAMLIRLFANDVIMIGSVRADWPAPFSVIIGNPRADKLGRNGFECIGVRCLVDRERCVRATFMHSAIENYSMLHLQRRLECRGIKRFGTKSLFMIISHNCQSCMCRQ